MNSPQQPDPLDRILREEDSLLPSSGFAASVMDAIHVHAAEPAPIPFPWKLAVPGMAALAAGILVVIRLAIAAIQSLAQSANSADFLSGSHIDPRLSSSLRTQATPALLALAASAVCILFCYRLAVGRRTR